MPVAFIRGEDVEVGVGGEEEYWFWLVLVLVLRGWWLGLLGGGRWRTRIGREGCTKRFSAPGGVSRSKHFGLGVRWIVSVLRVGVWR